MSEQWYWRHGRELRGPLDTECLEQLIAQHRVGDHDQIRLAGDEAWISGAEIRDLFDGSDRTSSSSEAAARLLSQARRLQAPESPRCVSSRSLLHGIRMTLRRLVQHCGAPVERIADGMEAGLKNCFRRARLLLSFAVVVLAVLCVRNMRFDTDERHRRLHARLTEMWQALEQRREQDSSAAELRTFADAQLADLDTQLDVLIRDSRDSPGRSSDSFARLYSNEWNWNTAHTRTALVQASQAMRSLLQQASAKELPPAMVEIYKLHIASADERLRDGAGRPAVILPVGDDRDDRRAPIIATVVGLDIGLVALGVWYWRRTRI